MKLVIQRVKNASVKVHEEIVGKIDKGFIFMNGMGNFADISKKIFG